jgi:hypothetical protein
MVLSESLALVGVGLAPSVVIAVAMAAVLLALSAPRASPR